MSNFDRFSERTRSVLAYAHEEARSLNQQPINTGHLLLSLLDEPKGVVPRVLKPLKVPDLALRVAVQAVVEFGNAELEGEGLSREAQQALRFAIEESQRLGRDLVEPEHVLLGLIRQEDGIAGRQLQRYGATLEHAQDRVAGVPGEIPTDLTYGKYKQLLGSTPQVRRPQPGPPPREWTKQLTGLTQRAQKAMELADEEAWRFNHNYIGTEHLLLGLVREGDGVAAKALNNMGVQLPKVRSAIEFIIGRGEGPVTGEVGLTGRSRSVMELARDESRRLGQQQIGTHHLLLGLVREGDGIAGQVLQSVGLGLEKLRAEVVRVLAESATLIEAGVKGEPMLLSHMTARVRSVVRFAEAEARRLGHSYYGAEHLLLGLLREGEGNAVRVLTEAGVTLRVAREAVEAVLAGGNEYATLYAGPAPGYERTLAAAINQSLRRGHHFNGSEHLLLALAEDRESVAGSVFHYLAVDVDNLAARALAAIDPERDSDRDNPALIPDDAGLEPPRFGLADLTDKQLTRLKSPKYQKSRATVTRLSRLALDAARQLGHAFVGTEHLLIALTDTREGGGAAILLAKAGVTPKTARIAVEVRFGRGTATIAETGYTRHGSARLNQVIDRAFDQADLRAGRDVLPEHLLLAILEQEGGSANRVLDSLRVDRAGLRAEVESRLQPEDPETPTPDAE